jgi:nucleoid DNA-binding protein
MDLIFKEVSKRLNISETEVKNIYNNYISLMKLEIKNNPHREIYFEKFGKFVPSIYKIKRRLSKAFKERDQLKVKKLITILKNLNYKPKHTNNDIKRI